MTQNLALSDLTLAVPETRRLDGVSYTVTIALPGSIVDGVLLPELKTYLAGQVSCKEEPLVWLLILVFTRLAGQRLCSVWMRLWCLTKLAVPSK